MEQLTVKEALKQGYEFYGFSDEGWQSMNDLKDFITSEATGKELLFNKEPETAFVTNAENVKEILVDKLSDEWDSETNDDTGEMADFLNDIPEESFAAITDILNEAMANKHHYRLTKIKLVP